MDEAEKKEEKNVLQEVVNKVVISPEDVTGAAEFWTHFTVNMIPELRTAFDNFAKDPSYENQHAIKIALGKAVGYTEHDCFHDEMFKDIVEECRNVLYDLSFDESLEATLDKEDDNKS